MADAPQRIRLVGQVVVEPENDRSNNLFSDDWREGVFGQIPYLNTAVPFESFELTRKRESKGRLV